MIDIKDAYTCPNCGKSDINILDVQQLFQDSRYDLVECSTCCTKWRVYYKICEIKAESVATLSTEEDPVDKN